MNIHLVIYKHKHGEDYAPCATREKALEVGLEWAKERAEEMKESDDGYKALDETSDPGEYLDQFNALESNWSYGEVIDIEEYKLIE